MPPSPRPTPFLADLPFYGLMALAPALAMTSAWDVGAEFRGWAMNWVLAAAACLGLAVTLHRSGKGRERTWGTLAALACLGAAALLATRPEILDLLARGGPWLEACKPAAYLLFALAWAATFGPPSLEAAVRSAAGLGLAVLLYLFLAGILTETGPMARAAALPGSVPLFLVLGLCAALLSRKDFAAPLPALVMAGLAASLSFTGLAAATLVVLFLGPWGSARNLGAALALAGLAVWVFVLGPGKLPLDQAPNTWWAWAIGLDLFINSPQSLFTGFPLGQPLPLSLSGTAGLLLAHSDADWAASAIHAGLITPFWLRLALYWGLGAVAGGILALSALLMSRPSKLTAGLYMAMVLMGLSCALFYAPGQAVVCLLLILSAREHSLGFAFAEIQAETTKEARHEEDTSEPA